MLSAGKGQSQALCHFVLRPWLLWLSHRSASLQRPYFEWEYSGWSCQENYAGAALIALGQLEADCDYAGDPKRIAASEPRLHGLALLASYGEMEAVFAGAEPYRLLSCGRTCRRQTQQCPPSG